MYIITSLLPLLQKKYLLYISELGSQMEMYGEQIVHPIPASQLLIGNWVMCEGACMGPHPPCSEGRLRLQLMFKPSSATYVLWDLGLATSLPRASVFLPAKWSDYIYL